MLKVMKASGNSLQNASIFLVKNKKQGHLLSKGVEGATDGSGEGRCKVDI